MYNGIVKSFAGKAGTEYVKKRRTPVGGHDYWNVKYEDGDVGELNGSELHCGLRREVEVCP